MESVIDQAIRLAGGLTPLAKGVGVAPASICGWRKRGIIPAERVGKVSEITGLTRSALRPDLFPELSEAAA